MIQEELKKAGGIFADPMTLGTPALVLAIQLFDEDCLEWDPVFLEEAIKERTGATIHEDVMQRLQALASVLASDRFFTSPEVFHIVCASVLDPDSSPEQMRAAPSPLELTWTCVEVQLLLGGEYSASYFSPQVRRYCGTALMSEGLYRAPEHLAFADFPPSRYPAQASQDETLAMAFEQDQQATLAEIRSSVNVLVKLYRQQLSQLAQYGGNTKMFEKLSGVKTEQS